MICKEWLQVEQMDENILKSLWDGRIAIHLNNKEEGSKIDSLLDDANYLHKEELIPFTEITIGEGSFYYVRPPYHTVDLIDKKTTIEDLAKKFQAQIMEYEIFIGMFYGEYEEDDAESCLDNCDLI